MIPARLMLRRAQSEVNTRLLRRRGVELDSSVRLIGSPIVEIASASTVRVGARTRLISDSYFATLGVGHPVVLRTMRAGATLELGADVGITGGAICAALLVRIGDGTIFGADVIVADTDFHPLEHPARRYAPLPPPRDTDAVQIGRNVFVGTGSIVLKGSSIGDNSVIGAGSVVRGTIPPNSIAVGRPARVQRTMDPAAFG